MQNAERGCWREGYKELPELVLIYIRGGFVLGLRGVCGCVLLQDNSSCRVCFDRAILQKCCSEAQAQKK